MLRREDERGEQQPLHADRHEGRVRLLVIGARERREVEQVPRHAALRHPAGLGHRDYLTEHLLHREGGPHLDQHASLLIAGVGEAVHDSGRDFDDVAGLGHLGPEADPEAHPALDDLEAHGLNRVDVGDRQGAARPQAELEGEKLAVVARGVSVKVKRSPVIGFSSVSPGLII